MTTIKLYHIIQNSVQATIISKSEDTYEHIKNEKIIAIDEVQFLDEKTLRSL